MYLNNMLRPRHKMLSTLMLYSTTKCQSRCKHCSIWQKPVEHLSFRDIKEIMRSKCISQHTVVGLEGGEFLLHPEADVIMEWFKENHPNYTLLSNCLNPQKVIDAVRKFHPAHLYVSLDGDKETYKSMRGCNVEIDVARKTGAIKEGVVAYRLQSRRQLDALETAATRENAIAQHNKGWRYADSARQTCATLESIRANVYQLT